MKVFPFLSIAGAEKNADIGIQSVVTLIDSDLPSRAEKEGLVLATEELILRLHDENERGRLFRMKPW